MADFDPAKGTLEPTPPADRTSDGGRKLNFIGNEPLAAILDLSLSRVLRRRLRNFNVKAVEAVQADLRREFLTLLQEYSKSVRGMTKSKFLEELEQSRNEILAKRNEAQGQLDEVMKKVDFFAHLRDREREAARAAAQQFEEIHRPRMAAEMAELLARAERSEIDREELHRRLVDLAGQSVQEDRRRIHDAQATEYDQVVDRFERRIAKLNGALAESERALEDLSRQAGTRGLASGFREVQGIDPETKHRQLKELLLREVYRANLRLQGKDAG